MLEVYFGIQIWLETQNVLLITNYEDVRNAELNKWNPETLFSVLLLYGTSQKNVL